MTTLAVKEDFANSRAGKESWGTVVNSVGCKNCGKLAIRAVDFDLIGDPWFIPICSGHACYLAVIEHVKVEMIRLGRDIDLNTFTINGFGKS